MSKKQLVFLSTHWGSKHGGINTFNYDFCTEIIKKLPHDYELVCVVLQADRTTIQDEDKKGIKLLSLDISEDRFNATLAHNVSTLLKNNSLDNVAWCIGHDAI